jgi:hypothetical protein
MLVGYAGSSSGNPTVPTHIAGDLLVVAASANASATLPTATNFTLWGAGASGNTCALAFLTQVAPAAGTTISLTGASGTRSVWVFRNAELGAVAYNNAASSTVMTWPALEGEEPISFVCGYIMSRAAQTNIATAVANAATGLNTTRGSTSATTPSRWVGDTTATYRASFPGYVGTFDSSTSGSSTGVFSVQQA